MGNVRELSYFTSGLKFHVKTHNFLLFPPVKAEMALRPTGNPNEYIYKDKFKVTREDDNSEWCCGECGAQWKDKFAVMSHIRSAHMISRKEKSKPGCVKLKKINLI